MEILRLKAGKRGFGEKEKGEGEIRVPSRAAASVKREFSEKTLGGGGTVLFRNRSC